MTRRGILIVPTVQSHSPSFRNRRLPRQWGRRQDCGL